MSDERIESLKAAIGQIEGNLARGCNAYGRRRAKGKIEVMSTGSLTLDQALGIGGLPKGRVVEIYGPESSGKQH